MNERSRARRHWSLLSSHGQVLTYVNSHPDVTVRRLAVTLGFSERRMMGVLRDLENAGMLRRQRLGRQNHYAVNRDQPLAAPGVAAVTVANFLDGLAQRPIPAGALHQ